MEEIEFMKIAIENYLLDCNTIDLCLCNYFPMCEIESLSKEICDESDKIILKVPPFFVQYKMIRDKYKDMVHTNFNEDDVEKLFKDMRQKKYEKYLDNLKQTCNEDLDSHYKEKVKEMEENYRASSVEARLKGYYKLLDYIRCKEMM